MPGMKKDYKPVKGGSKGKKMVAQKPVTKPRPGGPGTVTKPVLPRPPKRGR
jgi:hypothetical protein